ncbi:hypothetical protein A1F99_140250, partial [Pyrenophora tritici-repentis]
QTFVVIERKNIPRTDGHYFSWRSSNDEVSSTASSSATLETELTSGSNKAPQASDTISNDISLHL